MSIQFQTNKTKIHGFYREDETIFKELTYSHFHLHTPAETTARFIIDKGPYKYIPHNADKVNIADLVKELEAKMGKYLLFACFIEQGIYVEDEDGACYIYDTTLKTLTTVKALKWRYV